MRKRLNNLFFAVGTVAVVVMFFSFDVSFAELWGYITRAGYWLAAIGGLWCVLYLMNAWAWRVIIRGGGSCTVGFMRLLKLTVSGFALNYATPVGLLGGEAYRVMEISRFLGVRRATSSVILFAMMHIFAHFWFWVTGVAAYLAMALAGKLPMNAGMCVVLLLISAFCYGGIYLFIKGYKNGMTVRLFHLLCKMPGLRRWGRRFMERHLDDLQKIDRQIAELQAQNKRSFYGSFVLEYVGRFCQSFEIFFMLVLFGINGGGGFGGYAFTFFQSFLILAFTSLFANLLGFLPLQLGGREGGFAMSVAQMGMSGGTGMFVSIISRVRELFWASVGLLLMKVGADGADGTRDTGDAGKPAAVEQSDGL